MSPARLGREEGSGSTHAVIGHVGLPGGWTAPVGGDCRQSAPQDVPSGVHVPMQDQSAVRT